MGRAHKIKVMLVLSSMFFPIITNAATEKTQAVGKVNQAVSSQGVIASKADSSHNDWQQLLMVTGKVLENNLNYRSYPSLVQSTIMAKIPKGTKLNILYKVDNFYKVQYDGGFGFVYAPYVEVASKDDIASYDISSVKDVLGTKQQLSTTQSQVNTTKEVKEEIPAYTYQSFTTQQDALQAITQEKGKTITSYAMQFTGNPYVYGGNDLLTGVDCSGFTQQVMKNFNIVLPRTSQEQSKTGILVDDLSMAQAGDLLFFGSSTDAIGHVGIYMGERYMIHASTPETGIIISYISDSECNNLQVIRRMENG